MHPGLAVLSWRDRGRACRIVMQSAQDGLLDLPHDAPVPVSFPRVFPHRTPFVRFA